MNSSINRSVSLMSAVFDVFVNCLLKQFTIFLGEVAIFLLSVGKFIHSFKPIRSGVIEKVNDPGGEGALKAPPPYDLENYCINCHRHIGAFY